MLDWGLDLANQLNEQGQDMGPGGQALAQRCATLDPENEEYGARAGFFLAGS